MSEFYNQPAADWAKQNLQNPVQIKVKFSSLTGKIFTFLLVFFPPLLFFIGGIVAVFLRGFNMDAYRAFACAFVLCIPSGIIALLGLFMRSKIAKSLDADGVNAAMRQKYGWGKLCYVDHVSKTTRAGNVSRTVKDNQLELVFETGKVIIPPMIHDRQQIWNLINSMPVQVRDDGAVREIQSAGNAEGTISMDEILKMIESLPPPEKNNQ